MFSLQLIHPNLNYKIISIKLIMYNYFILLLYFEIACIDKVSVNNKQGNDHLGSLQ